MDNFIKLNNTDQELKKIFDDIDEKYYWYDGFTGENYVECDGNLSMEIIDFMAYNLYILECIDVSFREIHSLTIGKIELNICEDLNRLELIIKSVGIENVYTRITAKKMNLYLSTQIINDNKKTIQSENSKDIIYKKHDLTDFIRWKK